MSYEEQMNQDVMELAEETAVQATADETLFDSAADEEMEIEFEIEEPAAREPGPIANAVSQAKDTIQSKYDEAKSACKGLMERLSDDLEKTGFNPYIRTTTTRKYEILRSAKDEEPVDSFEFQKTSGFSLRAMALTSVIVAAADVAVAKLFKK